MGSRIMSFVAGVFWITVGIGTILLTGAAKHGLVALCK